MSQSGKLKKGNVYSSSRNKLYLFGRDVNDEFVIWKYQRLKWKKIMEKSSLLRGLYNFGSVLVDYKKHEFLLTFGGIKDGDDWYSKDIFVIHMASMKVKKCRIRCPGLSPGQYDAVLCAESESELLIGGFIRTFYDGYPVNDVYGMIGTFCGSVDYVHVIHKLLGIRTHFRMRVSEILRNLINDKPENVTRD